MKIHLLPCDEYLFLYSFKNETLPDLSTQADVVLFTVNGKVAGCADINAEGNLAFFHAFSEEERIPCPPDAEQASEALLRQLDDLPSSLSFYFTNIDDLLEAAEEEKQRAEKQERKQEVRRKITKLQIEKDEPVPTTDHSKAQFYLKEIATIVRCGVWTASNDKNRRFRGSRLGEDDLDTFPNFPLEEETKKRLTLIDTIWFQNEFPTALFEVETSTTVYSGLLRMADFLAVMPTSAIDLYIVAPEKRKGKVMKELQRPIFQAIGLHRAARFISIEQLEILYQKVKGLDGYIDPNVIRAIALDVYDLESSTS